MAYLSRTHDPRRRSVAIGGVVAIHAMLAVGLLNGLDVRFDRIIDTRLGAINVPLDPPPPPPEPKPDQPRERPDSYISVPTPPLPPIARDPTETVPDPSPIERPFVVDPGPAVEQPVEAHPTPGFTPRLARPRNQPSGWLSPDDYPRAPLVDGVEGVAAYRLIVGTSGRVSACEVTRSTGNVQLDAATCKFIERRARFDPATDENGAKVVGSFTGTVKWEIPE